MSQSLQSEGEIDGPLPLPDASDAPHEQIVLDPLETALAAAAAAQRWDVVSQLARELEARRLAAAGNVVALPSKRVGK